MINDQVQKQESGDSSTNFQGQSIIINQGISYADAKEIALDVYKANFLQLSQNAAETARARAEELTDDFLTKLKQENESAISSMNEPGMQAALYEAQKQYAKTGDKNLEGLLVDILVERANTNERNIHQIVLDEALGVASKLTTEQMDALTVNFIISKTKNHSLVSLESLQSYLNTHLLPFIDELNSESSCYQHLDYVGCGSLMHVGGMHPIEHLFRIGYPGLFSKGFDGERFNNEIGKISDHTALITRCLHDNDKLQINAIDQKVLDGLCEKLVIEDDRKKKITNLFNSTTMSDQEIKEYLLSVNPKLQKLFDLWQNSSISKFGLTTVGIAIAQANFRRKTGIKLDLSIWVK